MAAILKIQNGGLNGVDANANINFWIPHALVIPKMYRFANLQKFWTKIHSEPDYLIKFGKWLIISQKWRNIEIMEIICSLSNGTNTN